MTRNPKRQTKARTSVWIQVGITLVIACAVWVSRPSAAYVYFGANPASLGAIPEYPPGQASCHMPGAPIPKDVTFTVSGMPGTVESVEVGITFLPNHTWVGDLSVTLMAPGGSPSHVIFARTGATTSTGAGDGSSVAGPYEFADKYTSPPSGGWWQAATAAADTAIVASGAYRTTAAGGAGQVNPAPATSMDPVFEGVMPNGTWTLRFTDGCGGDTGSVSAANITLVSTHAPLDFEGNSASDFTVVRNTGPSNAVTWYWDNSLGFNAAVWGLASDRFVPADYDGDNKDDLAVWRSGAQGAFYIRRSTNLSLFGLAFGQTGDDPTVVGDYDGDNKADPTVYRDGAGPGAPSYWYVWRSTNSTLLARQFGQNGDTPAPGDYNGDGVYDFAVRRDAGGGSAVFYILIFNNLNSYLWGTPTDVIVPGDYDGEGRTDIAVVRPVSGALHWYIRLSCCGTFRAHVFGLPGDFPVQGDYDNDGITDVAVWRPSATPGQTAFYVLTSSSGFTALMVKQWGQLGDYPVANFNVHQ